MKLSYHHAHVLRRRPQPSGKKPGRFTTLNELGHNLMSAFILEI